MRELSISLFPAVKSIIDGFLNICEITISYYAGSSETAKDRGPSHDLNNILVLDMIMEPGIDGCEIYRRILENHPHQKAIIASGFSESERVREAQRLGAGAYIKKPYTLDKIARVLRTELDRQPSHPLKR